MAIGTTAAILLAASAASQAGGQIYASKKQAQGSRHAADIESKATADALAFEREQEAQRRKEFEQVEAQRKAEYDKAEAARQEAWSAEQARLAQEDARREPTRQMRDQIRRSLAASLGIQLPDPAPVAQRNTTMPSYWQPGMPVPGGDVAKAPTRSIPISQPLSNAVFSQQQRTTAMPATDAPIVPQQNANKLPYEGQPIPEDGTTLDGAVRFRRQYQRSL